MVILLIILAVQLHNGNELRTEISQNCGWGTEMYRCMCEKSQFMAIKEGIDNDWEVDENLIFEDSDDVPMDR